MGVLKTHWWIVPITVLACIGLLFAQESQFQSEPASVTTTRRYEGVEQLSTLSALNIDPQAFSSVLSPAGEIARFNSEATADERNKKSGFSVGLQIAQAPGDFSVVNREISDRNTFYSIIEVMSGLYTLTCTEANAEDCEAALNAGASEFEFARNQSLGTAINSVAEVIQSRLEAVRKLIASTTDQTALSAQRQLEIELASQVNALEALSGRSVFQLKLIDEGTTAKSATVSTVTTSTYLLGALIGFLVSVLIILQFAVLRSRRS